MTNSTGDISPYHGRGYRGLDIVVRALGAFHHAACQHGDEAQDANGAVEKKYSISSAVLGLIHAKCFIGGG